MSETIFSQSLGAAEIDTELREIEVFNDLVEAIDDIPSELKEELRAKSSGKFGSTADMEGDFAGRKTD